MKRMAALAALVLAFTAAGCGGGDDGSNVRNIGGTTTGSGTGTSTGSGTSTGGTSTESGTETGEGTTPP